MGQLMQWLGGNGLRLTVSQRATHTHVIGQPGTGKSRALESWIMQDIIAGRGVGVIDPHGDLYHNLVGRIATLAAHRPELAERVVLLDPEQPKWTVGFNPLEPIPGIPSDRLAGFLSDVIVKIWKIDQTEAPRMMRLLQKSFIALAEARLSLVDLPRFLSDSPWRSAWIARIGRSDLAAYFQDEFPSAKPGVQQWSTPVLNKIGPLIDDPNVQLMLGTGSTINFRTILDQKMVLLVNLSKGALGQGYSALLGAFVVAYLQQAALSRANIPNREPFFLYLDEFQNYTADNVKDILAETRKYALSLVVAHQYLNQLSDNIQAAVLNTASTLACFRLGYQDASQLSKELFQPGLSKHRHLAVQQVHVGRQSVPQFREEWEGLSGQAATAMLTQLRDREFWTMRRGGSQEPIKQRTLHMPNLVPSPERYHARKQLIEISGSRHGRLKSEVREEMKRERAHQHHYTTTYYEPVS